MNRKLPPNLYARQYRTRGGYRQTIYYIRFIDWKGIRRFFPAGESLLSAKVELDRLKALNRSRHDFDADKRSPALSLFPWADRYLKANSRNSKTLERYTFACNRLKAGLGDVPLADISHGRLLEYRQERRESVTDATINREMQSLRSILRMAYHDGALPKLPKIPFEQEFNERSRVATDIEYRKILAELGPDDRDFAEIVREMGFRPAEVLEVTPADLRPNKTVDMERIRKKRGIKRTLPLSPRAWSILSRRAKDKGPTDRLFPFSRHQARTAFDRACKKLGIQGLWLYDLKATFYTEKLRQGWPEKVIQQFTGHRSQAAARRYARPTEEHLRDFMQPKRRQTDPKSHHGDTKHLRVVKRRDATG